MNASIMSNHYTGNEFDLQHSFKYYLPSFSFLVSPPASGKVQIFLPTSSLKTPKIKANQIELRKIKVVHQCYNNGSLYYKKKYFYILSTCCKSKSQ